MKLSFLFGDNVCTLPATAANLAREAEPSALRVLLLLAGRPALRSAENGVEDLAGLLSLTAQEVTRALAFWQANGVLAVEGVELPVAEPTKRTAVRREEVPVLSGDLLAERLEAEEGKLRTLFGLGTRTLTKKEQTCIADWTAKAYPYELIVRAYEICVGYTDKVSFPYIDKVLQNWREKGYRTLVEVEAAEAERRDQPQTGASSFDTDEFFKLALERSYENLKKKE